jgi:CRISPR-associated protein Csx17
MKLGVHVGRIPVRADPQVALVDQLEADGYLERLRRFSRSTEAPSSVRRLVALLEGALFEFARRGGRYRLQEVLISLGELQRVVGASPTARDTVPPMPALSHEWAREADDYSHEFRLAAALAGLHTQDLPMRCHLTPVSLKEGSRRWEPESRLAVWGAGDLVSNLGRVLERRLLEAERQDQHRKPFGGQPPADLAAVGAFLRAETDDRRIARLLGGLAFVRSPESLPDRRAAVPPVPAAFAALKHLFVADSLLRYLKLIGSEGRLPLPAAVAANLFAGRVQEAMDLAWQRLRIAGVALPTYPVGPPAALGLSGQRLAAALLVPLRTGDLGRLFRQITVTPEQEPENRAAAAPAG